jgi:hypothetical protein
VNGDKYKTSEDVPYGGQTREEFTPLRDGNSEKKKNQLLKKEYAKGKMLEYFGGPIEHGTANSRVTSVQKSGKLENIAHGSRAKLNTSYEFLKGVLHYRRAEEGRTLITKLRTENLLSIWGGGGGGTQFASRKH